MKIPKLRIHIMLWLAALLVLIACVFVRQKPSPAAAYECAVIHMPKAGCPPGYARENAPRFTERNGSKEFACVSPDAGKEPCTDVLKSGESMTFQMTLPIEPPPPPSPSRRKL